MHLNKMANVITVSVSALVTASAAAATFDWLFPANGNFINAANWTPAGGPPGPADVARFTQAGATSNVIFIGGHTTVGVLTLNSGNLTFFLNGFTFQASELNLSAMGASNSVASLRVTNGTFQPAGFSVGASSGSDATLMLDTATMTVNSGVFQVGNSGTGNFIVQNGSTLTTAGDTRLGTNLLGIGTATVNGSGSSWSIPNSPLRIGVNGTGAVSVINGGSVTAAGVSLGESVTSSGTLTVTGADATFTNLSIANIGGLTAGTIPLSATLNIGPGATVDLNAAHFRTTSTLNMSGGDLILTTLTIADGAVANWIGGTITFENASQLTADVLDYLLNGSHVLTANHSLVTINGTMNLDTPLIVDGGSLTATDLEINAGLKVQNFGSVLATDTLVISADQIVEVENFGSIGGATLGHNNGGTLLLNGPNVKVTHFFANNFGLIEGTGRFVSGLNNGAGGTIRARQGDHLIIEGTGFTNPGIIELAGGTVEYKGVLSNLANGFITGRGTLRCGTANPGGNGLSNLGVMAFSSGTTDIFGDVSNASNGRIVAAGARVLTFYDDVTHNGMEIRTNPGSRTVFFGSLGSAGPLTGTGVFEVNGDLRPGNSPGGLLCEGDLVLSSTSTLNIELGGVTPSVQYDQVRVDGELSLSGRLNVTLINSFTPSAGNSFQIIEWGTLAGEFSQIDLPTLPETLEWDLSKLYVNGAIIAVPVDECRADIAPDGGDGVVNVNDLLAVINAWGACPQPCDADTCDADIAPIGGDCMVNVNDLLELINAWGPCLK